jgi:hypothetical protein
LFWFRGPRHGDCQAGCRRPCACQLRKSRSSGHSAIPLPCLCSLVRGGLVQSFLLIQHKSTLGSTESLSARPVCRSGGLSVETTLPVPQPKLSDFGLLLVLGSIYHCRPRVSRGLVRGDKGGGRVLSSRQLLASSAVVLPGGPSPAAASSCSVHSGPRTTG